LFGKSEKPVSLNLKGSVNLFFTGFKNKKNIENRNLGFKRLNQNSNFQTVASLLVSDKMYVWHTVNNVGDFRLIRHANLVFGVVRYLDL